MLFVMLLLNESFLHLVAVSGEVNPICIEVLYLIRTLNNHIQFAKIESLPFPKVLEEHGESWASVRHRIREGICVSIRGRFLQEINRR